MKGLRVKVSVVFLICLLFSCNNKSSHSIETVEEEIPKTYLYSICIDSLDVSEHTIKSGENFSVILSQLGFSATDIDKICNATDSVLDFKKLVAGKQYFTFSTQDTLKRIKYIVFANSATHFSVINLSIKDTIQSYIFEKQVAYKEEYMEGVIQSSLWNAIVGNGGDPMLALMLSDVYAWEIDFFDIKEGDAFKILYTMSYIDDTIPLAIESINGAIFSHQKQDYQAIPFMQDSVREYFSADGNSLRRAFLKAPMDFFRITSRFTNARFHPILKRYRAHHGVDYAAPVGTPVKTIGDGTVIAKGFQSGGGGNYLKIKHNSTYTTMYMHLKGFAKGVNQGSRVQQGQVIGYVGSTGLSTGPHLDFRVYKNGQPIDPLKMESPPSHPVKAELMTEFDSVKQVILNRIDSCSRR